MSAANANMHISSHGEHFIAEFEGCVLHPYNDPLNATIGVGHLIHMGVLNEHDVQRFRGFTYADAMRLLAGDVGIAEREIRRWIHVELTQPQFDALVSAVFNCGGGVVAGSVGTLINARQYGPAMQALQQWDHAGGQVVAGLARRRKAEAALFFSAPPPAPEYWGPHELHWMHEYDRLLGEHKDLPKREVLRAEMHKRALEIVRGAHAHGGWNILNRRQRYHSLRARS